MKTISERIQFIIDDNHMKKAEFAAKLGITSSSVSTMTSGKSNPSAQTITQICDVFGVNRDWLVSGIGSPYCLNTAAKEAAAYLSHAITHNSTAKDSMLRAIASLSDDALDPVLEAFEEFLISYVANIKARHATSCTEHSPVSPADPEPEPDPE